ncbi:MAG TPA: glycosyltransferase family 4 protein [Bacteroidia bacterium]|nr:glycosyltransferase family 4 protein [Bacteroidia bacterium]
MNILVFAHDAFLYGASQSLLTALKGIRKKADRNILVLLPFGGVYEKELIDAEINYKIIPFPRCVDFNYATASRLKRIQNQYSYYLNRISILKELIKTAKDFEADVIYTNTSVVSIGYTIAKKINVPHVWHIREFGDLGFGFKYYPNREKIAKLVNKSTKSIFVSEILKKHWCAKNSIRQSVVYNGIVASNKFTANLFKTFPIQNFKIGMIGAVSPGKEQHLAIEAFAELIKVIPNCELYFYGGVNQNYYKSLLKLIGAFQLEAKVIFQPFTKDKNQIYENLDLVISCTKLEAFGRTIVEAMDYGIPVIANSAGGVLEIIDNNLNGLLYNGTAEGLKNEMVKVLTDKNLYESLSLNGLRKAKFFGVETYVNSIDTILYEASINKNKFENK